MPSTTKSMDRYHERRTHSTTHRTQSPNQAKHTDKAHYIAQTKTNTPSADNVKPKPNIPPKEAISIMSTPMHNTSAKRLELIDAFQAINSTQTQREQPVFQGTDASPRLTRSASDTSHSAISNPDYTEKERQVCLTDTDTGILPGITRKCNMRSKFR